MSVKFENGRDTFARGLPEDVESVPSRKVAVKDSLNMPKPSVVARDSRLLLGR